MPEISVRLDALDALFSNPNVVPEEYASARPAEVRAIQDIDFHDGGFGACFFGAPGTGKTYAATALAYRLLSLTPPEFCGAIDLWRYAASAFQWTATPYLLARIRDTFRRKGGQTEKDIIDECIRSRVMVLDDLGAEKQTEFTGSTLYTILSMRRNHRRYTIITTNQKLGQIEEWEPRIASRMAEMVHVQLPPKDWRTSGKQRETKSKLNGE